MYFLVLGWEIKLGHDRKWPNKNEREDDEHLDTVNKGNPITKSFVDEVGERFCYQPKVCLLSF